MRDLMFNSLLNALTYAGAEAGPRSLWALMYKAVLNDPIVMCRS